jgi:hypothetical protein
MEARFYVLTKEKNEVLQEICIGSPWYFVDIFKGVIHIDQGFLLLDFEPKSIHHSKPIIGNLFKRTPTP